MRRVGVRCFKQFLGLPGPRYIADLAFYWHLLYAWHVCVRTLLGPSSLCLFTCVAWVSDFLKHCWVSLAPDTSPTLLLRGTCYTFNTLVVEFCLGRHLSVCLHASVLLSSGASYPPQSSEIWFVIGVGAPRFFLGVFLGPRLVEHKNKWREEKRKEEKRREGKRKKEEKRKKKRGKEKGTSNVIINI